MADDADRAGDEMETLERLRNSRFQDPSTKYVIPEGDSGDCELCGEWSARLVGGACAPCRDKYKLP